MRVPGCWRAPPHDQRATERVVAGFQSAVLGLDLDVPRKVVQPPRGVGDRTERVGRVLEQGIERLGGAIGCRLARAVEWKRGARVDAHQRHADPDGEAIRDAEVEAERRDASFGVDEHQGGERRANPLLVTAVRELALPRRDHRLEREAQRPGARRIGARASLCLCDLGQQ